MTTFRKALSAIAYISAAGAPILASTGVGILWGAALGAVGAVAGAVLHFSDNPTNVQAAAAVGTTVKGAIDAVRAAKGLPRKGQSGT